MTPTNSRSSLVVPGALLDPIATIFPRTLFPRVNHHNRTTDNRVDDDVHRNHGRFRKSLRSRKSRQAGTPACSCQRIKESSTALLPVPDYFCKTGDVPISQNC